jgi:hypothetical protein
MFLGFYFLGSSRLCDKENKKPGDRPPEVRRRISSEMQRRFLLLQNLHSRLEGKASSKNGGYNVGNSYLPTLRAFI